MKKRWHFFFFFMERWHPFKDGIVNYVRYTYDPFRPEWSVVRTHEDGGPISLPPNLRGRHTLSHYLSLKTNGPTTPEFI